MKLNNEQNIQPNQPKPRQKNRFITISILLFLIILAVGSLAFIFSMRQIVRENKNIELFQKLDIKQLSLESTVEAKISMVMKMANSPVIRRHFVNPGDDVLRTLAMEEIDSFRMFFHEGYEISWVNDIDRLVYSTEFDDPYWLDADNPAHYWYYRTLYETDGYSFNVNYNPNTNAFKMWVNAPVFYNNKPVGMVAAALELTAFINRYFQDIENGVELYLFNASGDITGAKDIGLVLDNKNIMDVLGGLDIDILTEIKTLKPGETQAFAVPQGMVAIGTVPSLGWYTAAFQSDSLSDYFTPMTMLFIVMIVIISLLFIVFNLFIAKYIKSISQAMETAHITMQNLVDADEGLQLQLAKLNLIIKTAKIGMVNMEMDPNNPLSPDNHVEYSDEYRKLLGFTDDDKAPGNLGDSRLGLVHPDDMESSFHAFSAHLLDKTGNTPFDIEQRLKKKNGEYAWFRTVGKAIRDEEGNALRFVNAAFDLTEEKKTLAKTENLRQQAEEANKAKSNFLAHMSHEIRTPMNAVIGAAEIQLQKNTNFPDAEEAFNTIYNSGHLLLNIINDVLDLSKIESGKIEIINAKYDIPSIIYDTVHLNLMRYESRSLVFNLNIDEHTPLNLYGDEMRIKQILNNLLSNAFKYTEEGSVTLSVSADVGSETDCTIIYTVTDTGQGMTEEQIIKVFDAYERFNLDVNRTIVGTGLGMNITKRLVETMGGEIHVKSVPGEGSVFTVRLPQKRIDQEVCGAELADRLRCDNFTNKTKLIKRQIVHEYMPYGNVLIVDDVETNLYIAKGMMLPYGLTIETTTSGLEAVEKIKNGNEYSVIFMDYMMPKMNGMEATKVIREMEYTLPIVALTANAVAGSSEMFTENGFDGYISKPIDIRELNIQLNRFIRDKQPPEIIESARRQTMDILSGSAKNPFTDANLATTVVRNVEASITVLEDICNEMTTNADIDLYTITVHGLRGALSGIGEVDLSDYAYKLEQAGENKDMAVISSETPAFIDALRLLVVKYKPREKSQPAGISDENTLHLRKKLNEIKETCKNYDINEAETILNDLKHNTWPHTINDLLDGIAENLLCGKLKEVVVLVDNFLNAI